MAILDKFKVNKRPIILFLGDSITNSHFVSRDPYLPENSQYKKPLGYKRWPDHITEYLSDLDGENYLQINLAKSGGSMEFAMQSFIHALGVHGNKIKYVFWGGTEWTRMYFPIFRWPIEWSEDRLHNPSPLQNLVEISTNLSMSGMMYLKTKMDKEFGKDSISDDDQLLPGGAPVGIEKMFDDANKTSEIPIENFSNVFGSVPKKNFNSEFRNYGLASYNNLGKKLKKRMITELFSTDVLKEYFKDDMTRATTNKTMGMIRLVRDTCIGNNIKFHFAQLIDSGYVRVRSDLSNWEDKDYSLLNPEKYAFFRKFESLHKDYFAENFRDIPNFPWSDHRNAYWQKIVNDFKKTKEYEISTTDSHPNEKGHKLLADRIWEDYVNLKLR